LFSSQRLNLVPLTQVSHALHAGVTLPWGVRDGNGSLLLAKGHVLADERAVKALLERGVFIDAAEASGWGNRSEAAQAENMSSRWAGLEARLRMLLKSSTERYFLQRVNDSIEPIAALANGNVDLLIFLILRHDYSRISNYGVVHSLHSAALCSLLSQRLGWTESKRHSLIGAALTMNISILDLQGQLASRGTRSTEGERSVIDAHPIISAQLLREAGLNDEDWLAAVEQHHEHPGGTGYPMHHAEPTEMSRLLRFVDCFTAKHSPRTGRKSQPAQQAARDLFLQSGGDPLAALVIKEFGIYPPGVYVKLASGETAIVTQRGATANAPIVAAITNKHGDPLSQPVRRDTASAISSVVSTVAENLVRVRVSVDSLYDRSVNR
jgi:HD-GYP domain-containing protein (c-di-GMP phosphodiesterase class II)